MWLTIITFATVGYGDLLPLTHVGRAIMLFNVFLGIILVSGILSAFNSATTMLPFESRMDEFMSFELTKQRLHNAAASLIARSWRWYRFRMQLSMKAPVESISTSLANAARRFMMKQSWLLAMNDFYVALVNFRQYDGRFQGDAHVAQCLRIMLRRASLCANHIFGSDREKTHVDNFIVNQMSIILTRDVKMSKAQLEEARIDELVSRQRSLVLKQEEADVAQRERRGEYSDSSDDGSDFSDVTAASGSSRRSAYQLIRRRVQRRQRLASIASEASSTADSGRRKPSISGRTSRTFSFRFIDAPSALQRRLPDIRAANPLVDTLGSDASFETHRGITMASNDSTPQPSEAWKERVDDQSPPLALKLALGDIRHAGHHSSREYSASGRSVASTAPPTVTARRTPTLCRSGSLRAADVLQYIVRTPPQAVVAETLPHGDGDGDEPPGESVLSLAANSARNPRVAGVIDDEQSLSAPLPVPVPVPVLEGAPSEPRTERSMRRRRRRPRVPGAHHHHHHLHADLPPPIPNVVEASVRASAD